MVVTLLFTFYTGSKNLEEIRCGLVKAAHSTRAWFFTSGVNKATILYYTILYYTILYYTKLYYTTLHYTTLYQTIL